MYNFFIGFVAFCITISLCAGIIKTTCMYIEYQDEKQFSVLLKELQLAKLRKENNYK